MNVKSIEKEGSKAKVIVEVEAALLESGKQKAYLKARKDIMIPGFRKGKCPRKMIEAMYGADIFTEDAINEIFPEVYENTVLKADGLKPVGMPTVVDIQFPEAGGVELTVETELYPEVTLGDYKGLEIPKIEAAVSDAEIEAELDRMAENVARVSTVDRAAQDGDTAVIDFEGFDNGVPFEGGKGENFELTIGSGQFIPGFEEQLIGMKTEEEKEINVTFPENYHVEELKGQPVIFKVKLHEIKKKVLPELDEELIKDLKIENVNTLDELKEYYRANLLKSRKDWAENKALDEAINKLVEEATVEIPEVMINSMCDNMINEYGQQFMAQGLSMEQFRSMFGENVDGLRNAFRPEAEKRVKTNLCLNKLAELENLNVGAEDLEKYYSDLAETYSMPVEDVKKYIPESNAKEDLKVRKALDFIRQ